MNSENICEGVDAAIKTETIDIPVRITMAAVHDAPFEFTASIDELGQIILTPTTKEVEFTSVLTESDSDEDAPIMEQEDITNKEENVTQKETSILIRATMIVEEAGYDYGANIDEIGQVIIYPTKTKNTFVTASIEDSLNLVTEDLTSEDYFGYKLINTGDGWNVIDYTGNTIEEGIATIHEAKILVCKEELTRLESLVEDINPSDNSFDSSEDSNTDAEEETPIISDDDIDAEVVEESFKTTLSNMTENFTDIEGAIKCDNHAEQSMCAAILMEHYSDVLLKNDSDKLIVHYTGLKNKDVE